jgi:methionyl-tRNA synthetase
MTTYVTVAIPYVNANPHLGYAYELVLRYLRPGPPARW